MSATTISGGAIWWTLREAGMVLFAGKTVWSMLERLWGFTTRRYINPRYLYHSLPVNDIRQGETELSLFHAKIKSQLLNNLKIFNSFDKTVRRRTSDHGPARHWPRSGGHGCCRGQALMSAGRSRSSHSQSSRAICWSGPSWRTHSTVRLRVPWSPHVTEQCCHGPVHHLNIIRDRT